jgi:hypothetical protein
VKPTDRPEVLEFKVLHLYLGCSVSRFYSYQFGYAPRLRDAPARLMRRVAIEYFRDLPDSTVVPELFQRSGERSNIH